jgi:hypothetical protein
MGAGRVEEPLPAGAAPSPANPEAALHDVQSSSIADEITCSSPISPWVLIMNLACDVVSRGVLLSVRREGFSGFDQFGVERGADFGDEGTSKIKIPLNEPSIFTAIAHRRMTYRGKIGPGKWNDYFLDQLGGKRPHEVLIIPIVVAGKIVAIFYGDDAGTGKPFGNIQRLEAIIRQTFGAIETAILAKRSKPPA